MQLAIHAAAPCPVRTKEQMIEWWGPILFEYYAATEGMGSTMITSEEWLEHRGSVGRAFNTTIHILDEEGNEQPTGEAGVVYFEAGADRRRLRVPQGPGQDRGHARRSTGGHRSATWATSTPRATCTSPTGATS